MEGAEGGGRAGQPEAAARTVLLREGADSAVVMEGRGGGLGADGAAVSLVCGSCGENMKVHVPRKRSDSTKSEEWPFADETCGHGNDGGRAGSAGGRRGLTALLW